MEVGLTKIPRLTWQGGFEGEAASTPPSERSSGQALSFLNQEAEARVVQVTPTVQPSYSPCRLTLIPVFSQ